MDFPTAVKRYGELRPMVSKRDHAVAGAITDAVGSAAIGALVASTIEGVEDRHVCEVIMNTFTEAVNAHTTDVPRPMGVADPTGNEIRDDGHTYDANGRKLD